MGVFQFYAHLVYFPVADVQHAVLCIKACISIQLIARQAVQALVPGPFFLFRFAIGVGIHIPVLCKVDLAQFRSGLQGFVEIEFHPVYAQPVGAVVDIIPGLYTDIQVGTAAFITARLRGIAIPLF